MREIEGEEVGWFCVQATGETGLKSRLNHFVEQPKRKIKKKFSETRIWRALTKKVKPLYTADQRTVEFFGCKDDDNPKILEQHEMSSRLWDGFYYVWCGVNQCIAKILLFLQRSSKDKETHSGLLDLRRSSDLSRNEGERSWDMIKCNNLNK